MDMAVRVHEVDPPFNRTVHLDLVGYVAPIWSTTITVQLNSLSTIACTHSPESCSLVALHDDESLWEFMRDSHRSLPSLTPNPSRPRRTPRREPFLLLDDKMVMSRMGLGQPCPDLLQNALPRSTGLYAALSSIPSPSSKIGVSADRSMKGPREIWDSPKEPGSALSAQAAAELVSPSIKTSAADREAENAAESTPPHTPRARFGEASTSASLYAPSSPPTLRGEPLLVGQEGAALQLTPVAMRSPAILHMQSPGQPAIARPLTLTAEAPPRVPAAVMPPQWAWHGAESPQTVVGHRRMPSWEEVIAGSEYWGGASSAVTHQAMELLDAAMLFRDPGDPRGGQRRGMHPPPG